MPDIKDPRNGSTLGGVRNSDIYQPSPEFAKLFEGAADFAKTLEANKAVNQIYGTNVYRAAEEHRTKGGSYDLPFTSLQDRIGYSSYDPSTMSLNTDLNDIRDDAQGYIMSFINSIGHYGTKAITTSAGTFSALTLGLLFAGKAAIDGTDWQESVGKVFDNPGNNAIADFDKLVTEEWFPVYRNTAEANAPLFSTENIFSEGFMAQLGDLFGFMGGAAISNKALFKALTKAGANPKLAALGSSFFGSLGEASIEANHAKEEFLQEQSRKMSDLYYQKIQEIENDPNIDENTRAASFSAISNEYQRGLMELDKAAKEVSTITGGLNMAILSLSNFFAYGKSYMSRPYLKASKAYKAEKLAIDKALKAGKITEEEAAKRLTLLGTKAEYVERAMQANASGIRTKVTSGGIHATNTISKYSPYTGPLKNMFREGMEEQLQMIASETSKNYESNYMDSYFAGQANPEGNRNLQDFLGTMISTTGKLLGTEQFWYEGMLGALMGITGSPSFTYSKNGTQESRLDTGKSWMKYLPNFTMEGNIISEYKAAKNRYTTNELAAEEINRRFSTNTTFREGVMVAKQNLSLEKAKEEAILEGNKEKYEQIELAQSMLNMVFAHRRGILADLEEYYDKLSRLTPEEALQYAKEVTKVGEDGKYTGEFADENGNLLDADAIHSQLKDFHQRKKEELEKFKYSVMEVERLYNGDNEVLKTELAYVLGMKNLHMGKLEELMYGSMNAKDKAQQNEKFRQEGKRLIQTLKAAAARMSGENGNTLLKYLKHLELLFNKDNFEITDFLTENGTSSFARYSMMKFLEQFEEENLSKEEKDKKIQEAIDKGEVYPFLLDKDGKAVSAYKVFNSVYDDLLNHMSNTEADELFDFISTNQDRASTGDMHIGATEFLSERFFELLTKEFTPQGTTAEEALTNNDNAARSTKELTELEKYMNSPEFLKKLASTYKYALFHEMQQRFPQNFDKFEDLLNAFIIQHKDAPEVQKFLENTAVAISYAFYAQFLDGNAQEKFDNEIIQRIKDAKLENLLNTTITLASGNVVSAFDFLTHLMHGEEGFLDALFAKYYNGKNKRKGELFTLFLQEISNLKYSNPENTPVILEELNGLKDFFDSIQKDIEDTIAEDPLFSNLMKVTGNKNEFLQNYNKKKKGPEAGGDSTRKNNGKGNEDKGSDDEGGGNNRGADNNNGNNGNDEGGNEGDNGNNNPDPDSTPTPPSPTNTPPVNPGPKLPSNNTNRSSTLSGIYEYSVEGVVNYSTTGEGITPYVRVLEGEIDELRRTQGDLVEIIRKTLLVNAILHLGANKAFEYVDKGNLKVGDEVRFVAKNFTVEGQEYTVIFTAKDVNGKPQLLNIVGINNYYNNNMELSVANPGFRALIQNLKKEDANGNTYLRIGGKVVKSKVNSLGNSFVRVSQLNDFWASYRTDTEELVRDKVVGVAYMDENGLYSSVSEGILDESMLENPEAIKTVGTPHILIRIPLSGKYRVFPAQSRIIDEENLSINYEVSKAIEDIVTEIKKGSLEKEEELKEVTIRLEEKLKDIAYIPKGVHFKIANNNGKLYFSVSRLSNGKDTLISETLVFDTVSEGSSSKDLSGEIKRLIVESGLLHYISQSHLSSVSETTEILKSKIESNVIDMLPVNTGFSFEAFDEAGNKASSKDITTQYSQASTKKNPNNFSQTQVKWIYEINGKEVPLTLYIGNNLTNSTVKDSDGKDLPRFFAYALISNYLLRGGSAQFPTIHALGTYNAATDTYEFNERGKYVKIIGDTIKFSKYLNAYLPESFTDFDTELEKTDVDIEKAISEIAKNEEKVELDSEGNYYRDKEGNRYHRATSFAYDNVNHNLGPLPIAYGNLMDRLTRQAVSTILKNVPDRIDKKYVDKVIEGLKEKDKANSVAYDAIKEVVYYIAKFKNQGYDIISKELILHDKELGVAGTTDFVLYNNKTKEVVILDLKTSRANDVDHIQSKMSNRKYNDSYAKQTLLYALLLHKMTGIPMGNIRTQVARVFINYDDYSAEQDEGKRAVIREEVANSEDKLNKGIRKIFSMTEDANLHTPINNTNTTKKEERLEGLLTKIRETVNLNEKGKESTENEAVVDNEDDYESLREGNDSADASKSPTNSSSEDDLFRRATDTSSDFVQANLRKEIRVIGKILPQLTKEGRIAIVNGLIKARMANGEVTAWGQFKDNMIILSDEAAQGTTYHEAFHYVFNMLMEEGLRGKLIELTKDNFSDINNRTEAEEYLAERFREYMQKNESDSFFSKIKRFFSHIIDLVTKWNSLERELSKVFWSIRAGNYAVDTEYASLREIRNHRFFHGLNSEVMVYNGEQVKATVFGGTSTSTKYYENAPMLYANGMEVKIVDSMKNIAQYANEYDAVYNEKEGLVVFRKGFEKVTSDPYNSYSENNTPLRYSNEFEHLGISTNELLGLDESLLQNMRECYA